MDLSAAASASFVGAGELNRSGARAAGAGDVNGDGYDDFLIGDYWMEPGRGGAGRCWLIPGGAGGWALEMDLTAAASASFIASEASTLRATTRSMRRWRAL